MIRLRRSGVKAPADWKQKVDAALHPKAALFWKKAAAFDKLGEHDAKRIAGFAKYAPRVLPLHKSGKKREFPAVWQKQVTLKKAITEMSRGFCAYCQVPVTASHHGKVPGQVEHFLPKSRFPMQAYDVGNYFLSCAACNGNKSDKWPLGGYVRPDRGAPGPRFVFGEDGSIKGRTRDIQAQNTVDDFDLRRTGLTALRKTLIKQQADRVRDYLRFEPHLPRHLRHMLTQFLVEAFFPASEAINQNVRRIWGERRPKLRAGVIRRTRAD